MYLSIWFWTIFNEDKSTLFAKNLQQEKKTLLSKCFRLQFMAKLMILADECMSDPFCADYPILDMPNILYRMLFRKPRFFLEIPQAL